MDAREAFVKMIKEENFYNDDNQSIRQHWSGKIGGFADRTIQARWRDYESGWKAALEQKGKSDGLS